MQRIKVAVLRGGPGVESEVSMKSGKNILENLPEKYIPMDVFVSKDRSWYLDGVSIQPEKLFRNVDVVFNAMHGEYGEDGKVQQLMDKFGVKYTGSKTLASAIGMNKVLAKEIFIKAGLKTPIYKVFKKNENINKNVICFFSPSGNLLIIPMPRNDKDMKEKPDETGKEKRDFRSIKHFIDNACEEKQIAFWKYVADKIKQFKCDGKDYNNKSLIKIYVNTEGHDVNYFHLRLDIMPKYYSFADKNYLSIVE